MTAPLNDDVPLVDRLAERSMPGDLCPRCGRDLTNLAADAAPGSFDGLPSIIREIADVAGLDAAMALAESYGGTIVYIPHRVGAKHWLVDAVGRKAADAICAHYRILDADGRAVGLRLQIPLAGTGVMAKAIRRLAKLLETGTVTPPRAARLCGVHDRTAWRVKAKMQPSEDDPQGRLL